MKTLNYDGPVPVDDDTVRKWIDSGYEAVRINFVANLYDILNVEGIEEWNEYVDTEVGVSLTDLGYGLAKPDPDDDLGENNMLLWVEGVIDTDTFES